MELFFFLLIGLFVLIAFLYSKSNPNAFANFIIGLGLMGIAANLFLDGLSIPNTGVTFDGATATFVSTTYTMSNAWVMGMFWMFLVMGFAVFGITIGLLASGRVNTDGSIR